MLPCFAASNPPYRGGDHTEKRCDLGVSFTVANHRTDDRDLFNIELGEVLPFTANPKSEASRMLTVGLPGAVFQIHSTVVEFVAVLVVDRQPDRELSDESLCYQSVNTDVPFPVQHTQPYPEIPGLVGAGLDHTVDVSGSRGSVAADSPEIRHAIVRKPAYSSPFFNGMIVISHDVPFREKDTRGRLATCSLQVANVSAYSIHPTLNYHRSSF